MKVQEITPINIWNQGELVEVDKLGIEVNFDNLVNAATFKYYLLKYWNDGDLSVNPVVSGFITMDGQDYVDWNADPDINQAAMIWVANNLNITLV